ncbi:MAG: hypothetical protein ACI8P9_004418, partial [Parasphingorhabdus sp.]
MTISVVAKSTASGQSKILQATTGSAGIDIDWGDGHHSKFHH